MHFESPCRGPLAYPKQGTPLGEVDHSADVAAEVRAAALAAGLGEASALNSRRFGVDFWEGCFWEPKRWVQGKKSTKR